MERKGGREHVWICVLIWVILKDTFNLLQNIKWRIIFLACKTELHHLQEIGKRLSSVLKSDSFSGVDFARHYVPLSNGDILALFKKLLLPTK